MRRVHCCSWLLVALFAIPALAQNKASLSPKGNFEISGTLVDAINGQPVSKARVAVAPIAERDNFSTMMTGEDGRFSFADLLPGKYVLTAQARGYLLQSFNQHDQYSSSIAVGAGLVSTGLLFRIPPESSISGVVMDEAGEPVRDATVMLYFTGLARGSDGTRLTTQVMTSDEGIYHFGHLRPGHYLIAVSAKPWYAQHAWSQAGQSTSSGFQGGIIGSVASTRVMGSIGGIGGPVTESNPQLDVAYPITFYPGVTEPAAATPIRLGQGEKATADLTLQPVPAIRIRISKEQPDSTENSFINLQRRVLDGPPVPVLAETRQISPGVVEVVGIPSGHYTVRNYALGQGPAEPVGSREIDVTASGEIDSNAGTQYVPVSAKLQLLSGSLPARAFLQFSSKSTREGVGERVPANGEVNFKQGVRPGEYEISLGGTDGLYIAGITAQGAKVNGRTLAVRAGSPVKLNLTLARGEADVTGIALRDEKPFAGAMIVLVPQDPAHNLVLFRRDQSDSDGTFSLSGVVPGNYKLLAVENGWDLEWTNPDVLEKFMAGAVPVQAESKGKYSVKVAVQ